MYQKFFSSKPIYSSNFFVPIPSQQSCGDQKTDKNNKVKPPKTVCSLNLWHKSSFKGTLENVYSSKKSLAAKIDTFYHPNHHKEETISSEVNPLGLLFIWVAGTLEIMHTEKVGTAFLLLFKEKKWHKSNLILNQDGNIVLTPLVEPAHALRSKRLHERGPCKLNQRIATDNAHLWYSIYLFIVTIA